MNTMKSFDLIKIAEWFAILNTLPEGDETLESEFSEYVCEVEDDTLEDWRDFEDPDYIPSWERCTG